MFLFTTTLDTASFIDYCTVEDGKYVLSIRTRHYWSSLVFLGYINFIYKTTYIKAVVEDLHADTIDQENVIPLSKEEYKQLLIQQRRQYTEGTLPEDMIRELCSPEAV